MCEIELRRQNCAPSLSLLDLNGNAIGAGTGRTRLGTPPCLTGLTCAAASLIVGDAGAKALARLLRTPGMGLPPLPLADLRLHDNLIGPAGVGVIADALRANGGRLKTLLLSGNPVGDEGAKALAWALEANTGLRQLYLADAGLGDEGAAALTAALEASAAPIEVIEVRYNLALSAKAAKRLQAAVDASIRRLGQSPYTELEQKPDPAFRSRATGLFGVVLDEHGERVYADPPPYGPGNPEPYRPFFGPGL